MVAKDKFKSNSGKKYINKKLPYESQLRENLGEYYDSHAESITGYCVKIVRYDMAYFRN